ncbi:MAG: MBL fold metallo-hydrolase, partial [Planctomycetota bacterium]
MKVEFWGAAQTVTGSMHMVHVGDKKILLDCGLYQGKRKEAFARNREIPFKGSELDAVILSHAHIDHSGNLPSLIRSGYQGPIYTTSASRDLAVYLLLDSAKIQRNDIKYVNRKRAKQNKKPFEPLYEQQDAVQTIKQIRTVEYGAEFSPCEGVKCRFHVAGHMLGAAIVELNLSEPGKDPVKLVFSGDIGRSEMPILKDPVTVDGADYVIMEATYGNRNHEKGGDAKASLLEAA